jgi:3-deoxy-D-manno-octulosonic-acid transferase
MLIVDLLYLLFLLLTCPFWIGRLLSPARRSQLQGRLRPQLEPGGEEGAVWLHAVSLGEVRSLGSLIAALEERGRRVVLSVTTPAGFAFARGEHPRLRVIQSPLDFSWVLRRFIDRVRPRLVVFNELELWPNWIWQLRRRRIPALVINGRISERAFRRYRLFRPALRPFFAAIDGFLVQNDLYRGRFMRLGIPGEKIAACGNIKADEADRLARCLPPAAEVRARLRLAGPPRRIAVLASSHEQDEDVFLPAIPAAGGDFFFIVVPRHVERAPAIAERLRRRGVAHALFSRQKGADPSLQVLIYDLTGYLTPIMSIADIVFMGGTFSRRTGGHNLYEPAVLGKPIAGGPHYENFPDIGRDLEANGAYIRVEGGEAWRGVLAAFPGPDAARGGAAARAAVERRRGSLACSLERIERYLA